tara:strand:- start:62 stop:229 length:168 start_codon:yes stop_codon:yes gene_type:complete
MFWFEKIIILKFKVLLGKKVENSFSQKAFCWKAFGENEKLFFWFMRFIVNLLKII